MTIQRGQKSIGLSNSIPIPATLPPAADNTEEVINYLLDKLQDIETLVEGKADSDRIRTLIAYSDEAVLIKAQDIVLAGDVTFANLVNEWNGTTNGEVPQSITRIIGDRIQTGTITSNNWGASAGSAYDLNNGTITIGGSDNPSFVFDGTDLFVSGKITASALIAGGTTVEGTGKTMQQIADQTGLTEAELNTILADGVEAIIAGQGTDFILDVGASQVFARHKDFNQNGTASYSGTLRTALLLSSNGIAMGYNRRSDGAFIPAVSIESTGDVAIRGTLTAESVISTGATVGNFTMNVVSQNAQAGRNIQQQLEVGAQTILKGIIRPEDTGGIRAGTISWDNTTGELAGGSGVAITQHGIIGAKNGVETFAIEAATGNATFAGDVVTGGQIRATGTTTAGTNQGNASIVARPDGGQLAFSAYNGTTGSRTAEIKNFAGASGSGLYIYSVIGKPLIVQVDATSGGVPFNSAIEVINGAIDFPTNGIRFDSKDSVVTGSSYTVGGKIRVHINGTPYNIALETV